MASFIDEMNGIGVRYTSPEQDIISEFYDPILAVAKRYDRASGYFTSSILVEYIMGLESFIQHGGKMRLVISPWVSMEDGRALIQATNPTKIIKQSITELFSVFKKSDEKTSTSAELLYKLIADDYLEVRVIEPTSDIGLFHDKFGIFYDAGDNSIGFEGSNNETSSAVSLNYESFMVMKSWDGGQKAFTDDLEQNFTKLWQGEIKKYDTLDLQECVDQEVFKSLESNSTYDDLYRKLKGERNVERCHESEQGLNFTPRDYQLEAAQKWIESKKGIISFATGTGKTKTAILCMQKYLNIEKRGIFVLVVPDKSLVNQWEQELESLKFKTVKCFSENPMWHVKLKDMRQLWQEEHIDSFVIIATIASFKSDKMKAQLKRLKDSYVFIADECHRLATDAILGVLPSVEWRLGLSATPEVYMSEELTQKLMSYFNGVIASYSLKKAIDNGFLVPYEYHPIEVTLTESELSEYREISHKLVKMMGNDDEVKMKNLSQAAQMQLFKRARVIYGASDKLVKLKALLKSIGPLKYTLVYCGATKVSSTVEANQDDDLRQLNAVNLMLSKNNIVAAQYTQSEDGDERKQRIEQFRKGNVATLVAIKCLDEGVDIPEIRTGIVLASSGNPRECIQRRGRLLRTSPGKTKAILYDMVALSNEDGYDSINHLELKRVYQYAKDAINYDALSKEYGEWFEKYGIGEED
ncbi:DEAD/DEAH box helicase family protein [Levilactobacillus wangkuiensis]|uniref:DEAD/DEAH box helicase family protein n=1 Tax=Levilactobacillus wangkuiensis TaxID=2799566 RepID=UPI0019442847|nr:DEAD/DEAH box helicase family protein [Levilactobacillus wangkuiensis]